VHMAVFPSPEDFLLLVDAELTARWDRLVGIRERVLAHIEPLRKDKRIGSSLQAKVVIAAPHAELALLERYAHDFIVSEVELRTLHADETGPDAAPVVTIERAGGVKCERCWRYVPSVSTEPAWAGICERCQDALAEPGAAA
jgi:isoleucyl-tRNA synthetase